jgi:hypothetical protein
MQFGGATRIPHRFCLFAAVMLSTLLASVGWQSALAQDSSELKVFQLKRGGNDFLLPVTPSLEFGGLCSTLVAAAKGTTPQSADTGATDAESLLKGRRTYLQIAPAREGTCATDLTAASGESDWKSLRLFSDFSHRTDFPNRAICAAASRVDEWPHPANRWRFLLDASVSSPGDAATRRLGPVRFNPVYRAFRARDEDRGGAASSSAASTGLRPVIARIPAGGMSSPFDEQCTLEFKEWRSELSKLRDDLFVVLEPLDPREPAYVFHDLARAEALFPGATPYFGTRPFSRQINRAFIVGMPLPPPPGAHDGAYVAVRSVASPTPLLLEYQAPIVSAPFVKHRRIVLPVDNKSMSERRLVDAFAPQGFKPRPAETEPDYQFQRRKSTALDARVFVDKAPTNRFAGLKAATALQREGLEARSMLTDYGDAPSYQLRLGGANRQQIDLVNGALGEDSGELKNEALTVESWKRAEFRIFDFRRAEVETEPDAAAQGGETRRPLVLERQLGRYPKAAPLRFSLDVIDGKQLYVQAFPITVRQFSWILGAKRLPQMQNLLGGHTWRQQCWREVLGADPKEPFLITDDEFERGKLLAKLFAANRAAAMLNGAGLNLFLATGKECDDRVEKVDQPLKTLIESLKIELKTFANDIGASDDRPMTFFQWRDVELLRSLLEAETLPNTPEPIGWRVDVLSSKEHRQLVSRRPVFCGQSGEQQSDPIKRDSADVDFVYSLFQPEGRDAKKEIRAKLGCAATYIPADAAPENTAAILGLTSGASEWLRLDGTNDGKPSRDPIVNGDRLEEDDFVSRVLGIRLVLRPKGEGSGK